MTDIKITIPREVAGKTLHFKNMMELQQWVEHEEQAYQWVSPVRYAFTNHISNYVASIFRAIHQQMNNINNNALRNLPYDGYEDSIISWFTSTYTAKKLILSTSSEFKTILNLKDSNPIRAAIFLGHLLQINNLYQNGIESIEMLEASNDYFQYKNGLSKKDLQSEKQALEELKKDWDAHLTTYREEEDNLKKDFEATKNNFNKYFQETQEKTVEHLQHHTTELEELKKTYNQYMALKAPVEYWKSKRQKHKDSTSLFKWWSLGIGAIGAGLFSYFIPYFFSDDKVSYWKITILVFLGTLFFWALRVLVKLMLSHIHLEGDAHEREVMCQTYLALLRDKTGLEESDKKLILTTLFRPSSSGIMGEDGIPPGFYDVITKIAAK